MRGEATLHFLCGKAGAGKSTVAKRLAQEHDAVLVSEDVWLARLYGEEMKTFDDYRRYAQRLKTVVAPLAIELLASGRSVVLDFPANTRASRAWFRFVFEQAGVPHTMHFLDTPDATCLARIAERNVARPEGSHHLTEDEFVQISSWFQPPSEDEGFHVRRYVPQPGS